MNAVLWQYRRASCEAHALASDYYALLFVCLAVFMTDCNDAMNLKLNNDVKSISSVNEEKSPSICVKEERRRTGRYIAILVGISLFILALYHAWVRRIPVVASLVVPALIMFVYVAWVLYTASRDKRRFRLFDVELGCGAQSVSPDFSEDLHISDLAQNNAEISPPTNKDSQNSPETSEVLYTEKKIKPDFETGLRLPIILVNDKPPEDLDQKWLHIVESSSSEKLRSYRTRRRYKRKFCRSKRNAAFKRSYSIG